MGAKKRPSSSLKESNDADDVMVVENPPKDSEKVDNADTVKTEVDGKTSMERRKKRKALDKEKHRADSEKKNKSVSKDTDAVSEVVVSAGGPGLHVNVFRDLASVDASVREAAAVGLVKELCEVQRVYAKQKKKGVSDGAVSLEAEKDDGLEECAPSVRYAIRRLIRGVSSSRECARQGFALGLAAVCATIPSIRIDSVMKLIVDLLEVSSSMRGQEAKDCLLGRLFAYGSLARSGRISVNSDTTLVKNFVADVVTLARKKRYLSEPVVSVILEVVDKAPSDALLTEILTAPGLDEWFDKALVAGDPDALFLALKLQEKVHGDVKHFGKLLPSPFNADNFFSRDHLLLLAPCFKESAFCLPRVHSLWPSIIDLLTSDMTNKNEDTTTRPASSKKQKRNKKGSSFENLCKSIRNFHDVVIEESLFLSSHDRKHLALSILLLVLPKLPESCIHIILSNRLVHGLMDILSNKSSLLYNQAQLFLKELVNLVGDDQRIAAIISLQKHSSGRFDSITRSQFVKQLVAKFNTVSGCLLFVQNLMSLFVNEIAITDEPSDQSQTTDENSELESPEDKASPAASGSTDFLKQWVIDTMPRCLKNLKLDADAKTGAQTELAKNIESKFRVQTEILKFLAVQGVFSTSLGTEITSFELQEKFKWPKTATSSSLCRMCIEQLQWLIEDAQKGEILSVPSGVEHNDLGSYFMCFLDTLCNIPSVSLYRTLSSEDEKAFKKLLAMESRLCQEERKNGPGNDASKIHALRYLLIQLLLQVLLHPGEFSEAALEIVICCKKAFPAIAHVDSSDEEECDGNDMPELMDVLVDTLLSLLPQSSAPLCFTIEQVFKFFCEDITDAGLLQMLRIVKKDLKPPRHQVATEDKDDDTEEDDDFLGIEEAEETDEIETADSGGSDKPSDDSEEISDTEDADEGDQAVTTTGRVEELDEVDKDDAGNDDDVSASDDSGSGMDDDAMFRMDSYIAQIFKERKLSGSDSALSQLIPFKLRVLSLLEIYLQKNSGKPQVLMVYSYLTQAFVNSLTAERSEQLRQRIGAILQKRLFKAKDYPKGENVDLSNLQVLLEKSLRLASRSRFKEAASLAQTSTFWLLKVIYSCNFSDSQLEGLSCILQKILDDYFTNKKSRLKLGFVKEVVRRNTWIGMMLLGFLLEKCGSAKSEFRRIETLDVIDCIIRSCVLTGRGEKEESSSSKLLKVHLSSLAKLIEELLSNFPEKQSRRSQVRKFCTWILHLVSTHNLKKPFLKALTSDATTLCELELGDTFTSFQESS